MNTFYIEVGCLVAGLLYCVYAYNKIVSAKQKVNEGWSGIDVQLKRRCDLIPNLMEIVKGYSTYENSVFRQITEARAVAISITQSDVLKKVNAEKNLEKSLKSLIAVAEAYPDLKANTNYVHLQEELGNTEDEIASARRIYNSNTADYNSTINTFPITIISSIFGYKEAVFFQNEEK